MIKLIEKMFKYESRQLNFNPYRFKLSILVAKRHFKGFSKRTVSFFRLKISRKSKRSNKWDRNLKLNIVWNKQSLNKYSQLSISRTQIAFLKGVRLILFEFSISRIFRKKTKKFELEWISNIFIEKYNYFADVDVNSLLVSTSNSL